MRSVKGPLSDLPRLSDLPDIDSLQSTGLDYIDEILEKFNVIYYVSQRSRLNIPATGRVIIFANHPVGSLDSMALLRFISEVRNDVKLVTMDLIADCAQLEERIIQINRNSMREQRRGIRSIINGLKQEQAVIVFPAVKAQPAGKFKSRDGKWSHRFLKLALYSGAPLLPVFMQSKISKRQPFAGRGDKVRVINRRHDIFINVGELIASRELSSGTHSVRKHCTQLRRHLYRIGKGKPGLFTTQKAIIHPQSPAAVRSELSGAQLLGETFDGQQIYLFDYRPDSVLLREIGRLREHTFRFVGEGTGRHIDLDRYDKHYRHIVLWNDRKLEIVGSYRLAEAGDVLNRYGLSGLYCSELFELGDAFQSLLPAAIELGRSFVQPVYWGKRSLDYLWYGIGAYLKQNPQVRYLYGPVSISKAYPAPARQALIRFYSTYFGRAEPLARPRHCYVPETENDEVEFCGNDYTKDFARLKEYLGYFDTKVPTMYKQYTELCEPGGVGFDAFSVDPNFGYCVDGLVRVDLSTVKQKKLQRYIGFY